MGIGTLLLIVLIVLLIGGLPTWPHMSGYNWGYYPSAGIGVVILILIVLLAAGRI